MQKVALSTAMGIGLALFGASPAGAAAAPNQGISGAPPPTTAPAPYQGLREVAAPLSVRGTDDATWNNDGANWSSAGGRTIGPPVSKELASPAKGAPGYKFYVVTGTDHAVYARDDNQGWAPISPAGDYCVGGPAATVAAGTLYVACEGGDHSLWVSQGQTALGKLPQTGEWASWGGQLNASPASLTDVPTQTPDFIVRGTDGRLWENVNGGGWASLNMTCAGHPSANESPYSQYATVVCPGNDGSVQYSINQGGGWGAVASAGGQVREVLQARSIGGNATVDVADPNGYLWESNVTPQGASGWAQRPGRAAMSPTPLPAAPPAPRPAPSKSNYLWLPTTGFDRQLLYYSDCRNHADMGYATGYFDTCYGGKAVLIGHNPGPFRAVADLNVGDAVYYWDGSGNLKSLRVTNKRVFSYADAPRAVFDDASAVVFYACYVPDGSYDWVIDAN